MKKILLLLFISSVACQINAQDSSHLRVSLLTCGQGDELYSVFGHTAIRITDSSKQTDIVYNYGTFDFNDPDFYVKFTRGTLDYMLSAEYFPDFMQAYVYERRTVTEQELLLTGEEKTAIREALNANLAGAARYYKYIFNYDNCTTRVRDMLMKYAGLKADRQLVPEKTTFRNMLHEYLDRGAQPWSKLGIDLLLGSRMDWKVNIAESMFLPDYLMKGVDSSVHSKNILRSKQLIHNPGNAPRKNTNMPLYAFTAIVLVVLYISSKNNSTARSITRFFDVAFFLLTGLLGCFLLFMWFGTDHKACGANYNLLWALPTNLVVAFALWKKPKWLKGYLSCCVAVYAFTLIGWYFIPQQINIAVLPIVLLMLVRSYALRK
ncbi:DUF4105 domain-containing protein [Sediminibacterium roseum]|uniref:DUF4105 domain-containing protein n=1 Tax=Sediminibacterium roseum TaxID=1978412 RepID=A0ABW9ZWJ8_9BACT|nr:DUF4105 domain-containing protein [Sediminibacterium roseum]NCI51526.1 DUF4105 domain-containing protein [Sediminibacterium roseum]